jgi:hypothetical protein
MVEPLVREGYMSVYMRVCVCVWGGGGGVMHGVSGIMVGSWVAEKWCNTIPTSASVVIALPSAAVRRSGNCADGTNPPPVALKRKVNTSMVDRN